MEHDINQYAFGLPSGHPIRTYFDENQVVKDLLQRISETSPERDFEGFFNFFNQLCGIEKRFARKENQLFPFLEKRGWPQPSRGMWSFHDQIRAKFKEMRNLIDRKDTVNAAGLMSVIQLEMERLIEVEEQRLFPIALNLLLEEDWKEMAAGESEIGWMHVDGVDHAAEPEPAVSAEGPEGALNLEVGRMTQEQISLMLKAIPFDLTFVDENDRVCFYNRGETRVFPRSPAVIGREVQFCHPPKSLDTVLRILEEFKSGRRDEADFWIDFKERKIHIRYFAVRDAQKNYKGVIEVSQDITEIQGLQGQKRLLNWE